METKEKAQAYTEIIKPNFRKVGLFVLFYVCYFLYISNLMALSILSMLMSFTPTTLDRLPALYVSKFVLDVVSLFPLYFASCLLIRRYDFWRKKGLQGFGWKNYVIPDMRKIAAFLVVWAIMPFPVGMFVDPGGFMWTLIPLSGPLLFIAGVMNLVIDGGRFYSPSTFVDIVLWLLVFPSLSYFLGCLVLYAYKFRRVKSV